MYNNQNDIHAHDREKPNAIIANLKFDPNMKNMGRFQYIFSRKFLQEDKANLAQSKLVELGQVSEQQYSHYINQ